jgi:hypothetical protein
LLCAPGTARGASTRRSESAMATSIWSVRSGPTRNAAWRRTPTRATLGTSAYRPSRGL